MKQSWGTREQAAELYGCSLSSIDRARKEGILHSSKILGPVMVELIPPAEFFGNHLENPVEVTIISRKKKQKLDIPLAGYDRRYLKGDSAVSKKRQRWSYGRKGVFKKKLKSGYGWYMWYYDENGKLRKPAIPNATCREDAVIAMEVKVREVFNKKHGIKQKSITLKEFSSIFLEMYSEPRKQSSDTDAKFINGRLIPYFGDMELSEITPEHVSEFICTFKPKRKDLEKVRGTTVNKHLQVLSKIFNLAEEFGYEVEKNPVRRKIHFADESKYRRTRVLSYKDEPGLMREAAPHLKPIIQCAILQLLRLQEIIQLRLEDVDFEAETITIRPEINKTGKMDIIPIREEMKMVFKNLIEENAGRTTYMFNYLDLRYNEYRPIRSIQHAFQAACRRAGIEGLQFRDLRRTGATRLHEAGVDPLIIQRLLRHSSFKISEEVYIQSNLALMRKALKEADLKKSDKQTPPIWTTIRPREELDKDRAPLIH